MVRTLDDLSHDELAVLVREYLMAGHLIDRAGMPQVIAELGREVMTEVAIDEWMGASPIYTRRTQELLGFHGQTDVNAIFKGMQFDIGAPPQFLDFRYRVHDDAHGEFHLDHCGALMDVEPMGEQYVVAMCHHIEDPTFDATACATNPRAQIRPIHRPPREPSDRHPHCHWTVTIEPDVEPVPEPEAARRMATTRAAAVPLARIDRDADERGSTSYEGEVDPDLRLEQFSRSTLLALLDEIALQGHLLDMAFLAAIQDRSSTDLVRRIGVKQLTGVAGVVASRLKSALGLGSSLDDVATVVELHPALHPRSYADVEVDRSDEAVDVRIDDCEALHESLVPSWIELLALDSAAPLEAIVQAVDPHAVLEAVDGDGAAKSWRITSDPSRPAAVESDEVLLTRFSTGADFQFT